MVTETSVKILTYGHPLKKVPSVMKKVFYGENCTVLEKHLVDTYGKTVHMCILQVIKK